MGNAATIANADVSKDTAKEWAGAQWDEAKWNDIAKGRETITAQEWGSIAAGANDSHVSGAAGANRLKWYAKVKRIGRGMFGTVDLVKGKDNRLYVMKIVRETGPQTSTSGKLRSVLDEASLLKELSHPNIVEFKEAFTGAESLCIVMAYCESGDLKQRIKKAHRSHKLFKQSLVMDWFIQMAQGLHYLHQQHIMHRDLKPQNIFLTKSNRVVKIGDFGVTQRLDATLAQAFTSVGTPYYMSPELCNAEPYNQKTDVWALGIILSELCLTEVPFPADTLHTLIKRITANDPTPIPDSYSPEVSRIINWMLVKNPTERPLMRDIMQDPFIVECANDCKSRLGPIIAEGPKSESELEKLRSELKKAQRKKKKYTEALTKVVGESPSPTSEKDAEELKAAQRMVRANLAEVSIQIFVLQNQLNETETNDTLELVNQLDQTLSAATEQAAE